MGSEPGMGWNWIMALATYCELYVISEGEYKEQCEAATIGFPIHWYWNPVPQSTRDKCWNQGNWSFYPLYAEWQHKTADIAREICKTEKIDILHQLNMIGFREPGYLWQVSKETGIPFVWGPVDAKDKFPMQYTDGASFRTKTFLCLKNIITIVQLKYSKRVHTAATHASVLLSASSNSTESFQKYMNLNSFLMNETGCQTRNNTTHQEHKSKDTFDILWVGKMDFRKQLGLALKVINMVDHSNLRLHILGGGDANYYKQQAKILGIDKQIVWHGAIPHKEVQELMQTSDIFLFTSVAEGTPHVVLEAIANGLPVVCHDTCGQGDTINDTCGIKIPLSTPKQSVQDFAQAIESLYNDRARLAQLSAGCITRAQELSWENKAKQMVNLYENVLHKK